MANSVNKVVLIGYIGRKPESRVTTTGQKVVSFSMATSESWKDRSTGEYKTKTEWHKIIIFNPLLCTIAEKHLNKGSRIYVEGKLQTREIQPENNGSQNWKNKDTKYITEIVLSQFNGELVLLDAKDPKVEYNNISNVSLEKDDVDLGDDEIPF